MKQVLRAALCCLPLAASPARGGIVAAAPLAGRAPPIARPAVRSPFEDLIARPLRENPHLASLYGPGDPAFPGAEPSLAFGALAAALGGAGLPLEDLERLAVLERAQVFGLAELGQRLQAETLLAVANGGELEELEEGIAAAQGLLALYEGAGLGVGLPVLEQAYAAARERRTLLREEWLAEGVRRGVAAAFGRPAADVDSEAFSAVPLRPLPFSERRLPAEADPPSVALSPFLEEPRSMAGRMDAPLWRVALPAASQVARARGADAAVAAASAMAEAASRPEASDRFIRFVFRFLLGQALQRSASEREAALELMSLAVRPWEAHEAHGVGALEQAAKELGKSLRAFADADFGLQVLRIFTRAAAGALRESRDDSRWAVAGALGADNLREGEEDLQRALAGSAREIRGAGLSDAEFIGWVAAFSSVGAFGALLWVSYRGAILQGDVMIAAVLWMLAVGAAILLRWVWPLLRSVYPGLLLW